MPPNLSLAEHKEGLGFWVRRLVSKLYILPPVHSQQICEPWFPGFLIWIKVCIKYTWVVRELKTIVFEDASPKCKLLANVLVKSEVRSEVWDSEKQSCRDLVTRGSEYPVARWWQSGKGTEVQWHTPRKDNPRGQFLGPQLEQTSDHRARKVISNTIMDWVYHVQGNLLPFITFTTSKPSLHSFCTSAFNISMPVVLGLSRESELIGCKWFFIRDWLS